MVNIASTAGVRPRPGLTVYNASKGAVVLMSKSMAAEFAPDNVRVNCVNPVFNPDTALSTAFAGGELDDARLASFSSRFRSDAFQPRRTSRTRASTWLRMKRASSPGSISRWMADAACELIESRFLLLSDNPQILQLDFVVVIFRGEIFSGPGAVAVVVDPQIVLEVRLPRRRARPARRTRRPSRRSARCSGLSRPSPRESCPARR